MCFISSHIKMDQLLPLNSIFNWLHTSLVQSCVAQVRLVTNQSHLPLRLKSRGIIYNFHPNNMCSVCNLNNYDDLFHFLFRCLVLTPLRKRNPIFQQYDLLNNHNWQYHLNFRSTSTCYQIANFIKKALVLRAWLMNM